MVLLVSSERGRRCDVTTSAGPSAPVRPHARAVALRGSTVAAYERDWTLFGDWCAATGRRALPARVDTVLAFLTFSRDSGAMPATLARRVGAINAAHRAAGCPEPGRAARVIESLRVWHGLPATRPPRIDPELLAEALRTIVVQGWPLGYTGRRDAAALALVAAAALSRAEVAALTRADVSAEPGRLVVRRPDGSVREEIAADLQADPGGCPVCAVTRWARAHDITSRHGWRRVREILAERGETTAAQAVRHDCLKPLPRREEPGRGWPLLFALDRYARPASFEPLSQTAISGVVSARLLAATAPQPDRTRTLDDKGRSDVGGHLADPAAVTEEDDDTVRDGAPVPPVDGARAARIRKDAACAMSKVEELLDEIDARADLLAAQVEMALAQTGETVSHMTELSKPH